MKAELEANYDASGNATNSAGTNYLQPARPMTLTQYQQALAATADKWVEVVNGD